tara:strand:+ start:26316 stop:27251 length:936 start_codon:yes stop_codon:yes gene_type:complete
MSCSRINWVDKLKTLGILSVILGHIDSPLNAFIFSWHMPLFFFLSGFFIDIKKSINDFAVSNFNRLMIPYFIFSILALIIEPFKRILLGRENIDVLNELIGIFFFMDYPHLINTYGFVLWFLPTLFFGRLIVFVVINKINSSIIQISIVSMLFYTSFSLDLIFGIDNALNSILFIYLGYLYYSKLQNEKRLSMLIFVFFGIIILYGIPPLNMSLKNFDSIFINIIYSVSFILLLITLTKVINIKSKLILMWGTNTMLLFIVHPYTNNMAHLIVSYLETGGWSLKFIISVLLLHIILLIREKYNHIGIFKYV